MEPRNEEKKSRFRIEKLEERIAPIIHPLVPIGRNGAFEASGGRAGGTAAGGAIDGSPVGAPVPLNNPGRGPQPFPVTGRGIPS